MGQDSIFLIGVVVIFFALSVVPQFIQRRKHEQELGTIMPGAWVITAGGIVGQVVAIDSQMVKIKINPDTEMTLARRAVRSRTAIPEGMWGEDEEEAPNAEPESGVEPGTGAA